MATLDFTPLYRSSVGFDQLPELLSHALQRIEPGFPPYDIEKLSDDRYRVVMAVSGLGKEDIDIVQEQNVLTVRGKARDAGPKTYLHRGIPLSTFEQKFNLADHVEVTGALLENGLLKIDLNRELPEALKPRRIPLGGDSRKQIETPSQPSALHAA